MQNNDSLNKENVHKLVYLANTHRDYTITDMANIFQLTPFDYNLAAWQAEDQGFLRVNKEVDGGKITILDTPRQWEFGKSVERIIEYLPYVLEKLAAQEYHIEEEYLKAYFSGGYPTHDYFVAIDRLKELGVIASYNLLSQDEGDEEGSTYTFYGLAGDVHHKWGKKQFKDLSKVTEL